ncbi:MAG TPA: hypothetical protein VHN16_18220 [Streptosporangiaceae bacterium]|nr:hypothetical protein [Streptosporangiaceae bacterium]
MSNIHSAASLVVGLCLRRARKRPVRSGGRAASRIVAVLAVAVMIGGATAAQAAASTGPSIALNGDYTNIAVQGPNDSLKFYQAVDGSSTWNAETVAGSGTTYSAPSMILNGDNVNIAAMGEDNSLDCYAATVGMDNWDPAVPCPAANMAAGCLSGLSRYPAALLLGPTSAITLVCGW